MKHRSTVCNEAKLKKGNFPPSKDVVFFDNPNFDVTVQALQDRFLVAEKKLV